MIVLVQVLSAIAAGLCALSLVASEVVRRTDRPGLWLDIEDRAPVAALVVAVAVGVLLAWGIGAAHMT